MRSTGKTEKTFKGFRQCDTQPACLHALANVHKGKVKLPPFTWTPGSVHYAFARQLVELGSELPQPLVNTNAKAVVDKLSSVTLDKDEILEGLDVESFFTNVPFRGAIDATAALHHASWVKMPRVDETTFADFSKLFTVNALILTESGLYCQADGVVLGNPVEHMLANYFMSQIDEEISSLSRFSTFPLGWWFCEKNEEGRTVLFARFFQHNAPDFENHCWGGKFCAWLVILSNNTGKMLSSWFRMTIDKGVVLNYHSVCPNTFHSSFVSCFVHRIFNNSSHWAPFHRGSLRA